MSMLGELFLWGIIGGVFSAALGAAVVRTKDSLAFTDRRTCAVCAVPTRPMDMLPVAGYILMQQKCYRCQSVQPWQYLAIDLLAMLIFAWLYLTIGPSWTAVLFACALTLLLYAAWFDYRASFLPDRLIIPAFILIALGHFAAGTPFLGLLLGALLLGAFAALQFLFAPKMVTPGEIRLHLTIGLLLGAVFGPFVLVASYIVGSLIGGVILLARRRELHSHVPHGTFLIATALFTWCFLLLG